MLADQGLKRIVDILLSLVSIFILSPLFILVAILIKSSSPGPVVHVSRRVGKGNRIFCMYKFRTMTLRTPDKATHLLEEPEKYITPLGKILRKSSIDELPQLFNVLKGDMSLVGPRPALHNQRDLIDARTKKKIHQLLPGITGFAQISGRDGLTIPQKVRLDEYYLRRRSVLLDFKIILKTFYNVILTKDVSH